MPVVTNYTALISGSSWSGIEVTGKPAIVTFSFPATVPGYDAAIPGFSAATLASYQAFSAAAQTQVRAALAEWSAASGLVFLEVAPGQGDLSFQAIDFATLTPAAGVGPGAGGMAFYPFGDWDFASYPYFKGDLDASGDVFMNTAFLAGGSFNYGTLLHEIGHAIGLKHPTEVVTNFAADPDVRHDQVLASNNAALTIMATGAGTAVLKQLDKDAAAFLYGAAGTGGTFSGSASGSNAFVTWSWAATTQVLTQTATAAADAVRGSSVGDVINGLGGDDSLFGLAGNDSLFGGDGNDLLSGGLGTNTMTGGTGDDSYLVSATGNKVVEKAGGGHDVVSATVGLTLSANVEDLYLYGGGLTGRGNSGANNIFGDGVAASTVYGGGGADYLVTGGVNDRIFGGAGEDWLYGGSGNDTLDGGSEADYLDGGAGADRFSFAALTGGALPGHDVIGGFQGGVGVGDVIAVDDGWLTPLGITTKAGLVAAFSVSGADLRLSLGAAGSITLSGMAGLVMSTDDVLIV